MNNLTKITLISLLLATFPTLANNNISNLNYDHNIDRNIELTHNYSCSNTNNESIKTRRIREQRGH